MSPLEAERAKVATLQGEVARLVGLLQDAHKRLDECRKTHVIKDKESKDVRL